MRMFVVILKLTETGRFHPCYYIERPLPGSPENLVRFKSGGHHTDGYATLEEAQVGATEMARVMEVPDDRVITDVAMVTDDPVGVRILPPWGASTGLTFRQALGSSI